MFSNMLVSFKQRFKKKKKTKINNFCLLLHLAYHKGELFIINRGNNSGQVTGVEGEDEEEADKILCV